MNKRKIMFLGLLMFPTIVFSQAEIVHFNYDANGNRFGRTLTVQRDDEINNPTDTLEQSGLAKASFNFFDHATISIFPNPTHDKFTVVLEGLGNMVTVSLVTLVGDIIEQCELFDGTHSFDMKKLPPGIYLLHLTAPKVSRTWKIIKN